MTIIVAVLYFSLLTVPKCFVSNVPLSDLGNLLRLLPSVIAQLLSSKPLTTIGSVLTMFLAWRWFSTLLCIRFASWTSHVYRIILRIVLYLSIYNIALLTAWAFQKRSRLHHWYCFGVNTPKRYRQLGEGLTQGTYLAATTEPYHWATTPHKLCRCHYTSYWNQHS